MKNENGQEKSAILKGQTLVNLLIKPFDSYVLNTATNTGHMSYTYPTMSDTKYLLSFRVSNLNLDGNTNGVRLIVRGNTTDDKFTMTNIDSSKLHNDGIHTFIFENSNSFKTLIIGVSGSTNINTPSFEISELMLIPYQEGMENWDIPYFEGMQSVKLPVLKTTGKNLFDYKNYNLKVSTGQNPQEIIVDDKEISFNVNTASWKSLWYDLYLEKGKKYTLSYNTNLLSCFIFKSKVDTYVSSQLIISATVIDETEDKIQKVTKTFTAPSGGFIRVRLTSDYKMGNHILQNFQIEEGSTATSYEPYKSNILTVNEDVTLRGIGDVKDELNLLTGEVVERIGEIVLDGSQTLQPHSTVQGDTLMIKISDPSISFKQNSNLQESWDFSDMICDKELIAETPKWNASEWNEGYNIALISSASTTYNINSFVLAIRMSYFNVQSIDEFKTWLTQNPLTIQYKLAKESIKTVDLTITDQDNQPQERMKLFPNGYINTSSSTIPPILEIKGIVHNNKLNMTTTNGTNNTQLATLDNLVLDGIICRDGTVVRDSYDVESGLYTKRVFRATIDEQFINNYTWNITLPSNYQVVQFSRLNPLPKPYNVSSVIGMLIQ